MTLAHSVDEALDRFDLIAGTGSPASNQGCAMTVLSWVAGEAWTDWMACANAVLCRNVIAANDAPGTTPEQRAEMVRLGEHGVIDTWWVPDQVVVWALSGDKDTPYVQRVIDAIGKVARWKETHEVPDLTRADLTGAYLAGAYLTRADLTGANLTGADLTRAYLAGAYLTRAYLAGANLTRAYLAGARGSRFTVWPDGFDVPQEVLQ